MRYVLDSSVALSGCCPNRIRAERFGSGTNTRTRFTILYLLIFSPRKSPTGWLQRSDREGSEPAKAILFLHDIARTAPAMHPTPLLLVRAIEISLATKQAVYDCIYLALAESDGCEMVSADDQFVRKLRPAFPMLIRLADLP